MYSVKCLAITIIKFCIGLRGYYEKSKCSVCRQNIRGIRKKAEKLEGLIHDFASAQQSNVWEWSVRILIFQYRKQLNGSIL